MDRTITAIDWNHFRGGPSRREGERSRFVDQSWKLLGITSLDPKAAGTTLGGYKRPPECSEGVDEALLALAFKQEVETVVDSAGGSHWSYVRTVW